jgi:hypothetical protein
MLLKNVPDLLQTYEHDGLHYHLAATSIYAARERIGDVFSEAFLPYIIAGLLAYDMARQLGKAPYQAFAERLMYKLDAVRPLLSPLMRDNLATIDLDTKRADIGQAYDLLASRGSGGLHSNHTCAFYVGASKILHWLNPELFLILDSHIATAFHHHPDASAKVSIMRSGSPCYSAEIYLQCLACAQREIVVYGEQQLRRDGNGLPLANIYGNVAFQIALEQSRVVRRTLAAK